jgi:hypothetical protein
MKDIPKNSTFQFDFLRPFEFFMQTDAFYKENKTNWNNNFLLTVVELREGVPMRAFSKKIANLNIEKNKTLKNLTLFLHPMKNWNLRNVFLCCSLPASIL